MFSGTTAKLVHRFYCTKPPHPFTRTVDIISGDIKKFFNLKKKGIYPEHTDIVIIGGGFIGSAVAYWLKTRAGAGLSVVVLEKDPTYKNAVNNVLQGTLSQHFGLPENILLSQFMAEFLRNGKELLNQDVDFQYCPTGQLVLACEKYAPRLEENVTTQREYGLKNDLISVKTIKERYPGINTDDVALGCIAYESEGTFSSWRYLQALVRRCIEQGVEYVCAEAESFQLQQQRDMLMEGVAPGTFEKVMRVTYRGEDGNQYGLKFAGCVLACGHETAQLAQKANIGLGKGMLSVPLPVEKREYSIYSVDDTTRRVGLDFPTISDSSGLWLRRDGLQNNFLCGHLPSLSGNTMPEQEHFHNIVKPTLVNRVPDFQHAQISRVHTEYQDVCTFDDSGVIGNHPYHNNLYFACGFGRYGVMQSMGIGRAIAELIVDSQYMSVDLVRLGFDRFLTAEPHIERNSY